MDKRVREKLLTVSSPRSAATLSPGFSLVELLVVIGIFVILLVATVPAVNDIARGTNLERGGQMLVDAVNLARQEAVAKNCEARVVFLQMADDRGEKVWRGVQVLRIENSPGGISTNPATKIFALPQGMIISANSLSPLLDAATNLSGTSPAGVTYRSVRFRANGFLDSGIAATDNYVTVQHRDAGDSPANFFTIQINPVTGKISSLRP